MNDFKTDAELARKGDTEAFSRLYSMVYKEMYHTALYNLRSSHDAADAVSDAVADAFETIGKLPDAQAFRAWIMKILFTNIKKRQKEYMKSNSQQDETVYTDDFNFSSSELKEALESLDDQSRAILSLSVLGGYKSMEIAQISGMKASAVRSKLSRVKSQLRLKLCE